MPAAAATRWCTARSSSTRGAATASCSSGSRADSAACASACITSSAHALSGGVRAPSTSAATPSSAPSCGSARRPSSASATGAGHTPRARPASAVSSSVSARSAVPQAARWRASCSGSGVAPPIGCSSRPSVLSACAASAVVCTFVHVGVGGCGCATHAGQRCFYSDNMCKNPGRQAAAQSGKHTCFRAWPRVAR